MKKIIGGLILAEPSDLRYGFDDNGPHITLQIDDCYDRSECVDPHPCYTHDVELVKEELQRIEKLVSLPFAPRIFIFPFESYSRVNGTAHENITYIGDKTELRPYIILSGKRIPIHPAVTRYVLSHEYAHIVHYNYNRHKKCDHNEVAQQYAVFRGLEYVSEYHAGNWHRATDEIIANDIRITLFGAEPDFWPHDCEHPLKNPKIREYWLERVEEMRCV